MKTAVFLFDLTGNMAQPWLEAGYECWIVDMQHPEGITREGDLVKVGADLMHGVPGCLPATPYFVAAWPSCQNLAVSGSRWFKGKGLRSLADSIHLFATSAEYCESTGAAYLIENPVSTISTYWRKPDYTFHPYEFTEFCLEDNYTKKTCLWTGGGFVMPNPAMADLSGPDDRIHKAAPGTDRANIRSATPMGFARAVYEANKQGRAVA